MPSFDRTNIRQNHSQRPCPLIFAASHPNFAVRRFCFPRSLYQPSERVTHWGFPNREQRDSRWQTEGVCHGPSNSGAGGLYGRRGSPVCAAREGCRAGTEAVSDCGGTRWKFAGRCGEDRRDGSPDPAGLRDPVQRARAGWSHQHPLAWRAARARRQAQGLSRPDREGGSDPCGPRRSSLACVRSHHAALPGVCALGVGRHHLSRPEGLGLLACERPAESLQAGRRGGHGIQKNFALRVAEIRATLPPGTPVEVWFQDEMRVGQKNKLTYRWARKGSGPRAIHDQRTQSTYLFGAVCPERGAGAALVLPACNTEAMQLHLDEIATKVTPGQHAILILDQPGWHGAKDLKAPKNITLLSLPPRAPELNPQENIWQFMRANWLSNRIFKSFDEIVDHGCYAWNTLIDQPWKIMSIARRDWAVAGHLL